MDDICTKQIPFCFKKTNIRTWEIGIDDLTKSAWTFVHIDFIETIRILLRIFDKKLCVL